MTAKQPKHKVKKSPYPFTLNDIDNGSIAKQKKMRKALVYDFLKKERLLGFYYDSYVKARGENPNSIAKPFRVYLERASVESVTRCALRDFFFDVRVNFDWTLLGDIGNDLMIGLDRKWVMLVDNKIMNDK